MIYPRHRGAISHGSTCRPSSEAPESNAGTTGEQTATSGSDERDTPKRRQYGLLYPRASSPLTENFPGRSCLGACAKSVADGVKSLTCRVFAACYEMRRGSVPGRKRRRVRTSSLGRVPLVGEDKAESPGFVRRFNEKMELADIEIAAWRGDISSASSVVPLIVQTKKGRCPWYDRTPLIRTLVV